VIDCISLFLRSFLDHFIVQRYSRRLFDIGAFKSTAGIECLISEEVVGAVRDLVIEKLSGSHVLLFFFNHISSPSDSIDLPKYAPRQIAKRKSEGISSLWKIYFICIE